MNMLKRYLARKLPALAAWANCSLFLSPDIDAAAAGDTARLVTWAELTFKEQSGEFKRHQVYAKLLKLHPDVNKRELGLAIEIEVRKL